MATTHPPLLPPSAVFLDSETTDKPTAQHHKRTYQACIPCRRRKVRCDLGPVDDPHDPPCVRCRRESKNCYFSPTRRKRKNDGENLDDDVDDDYAIRNRRRKTDYIQSSPVAKQEPDAQPSQHGPSSVTSHSLSTTPPMDGYISQNVAQQRLDPYHSDPIVNSDDPPDQEVTNDTAVALFQTPINTPGDALHLLLEASGRSEDFHEQGKTAQVPRDRNRANPDKHRFTRPEPIEPRVGQGQTNIDPAIASHGLNNVIDPDVSRETLRIWSRLRFVRAGWLTAREAMSYVNYFYEYLSPLTPINPPDFRLLSTHTNLMDEEPILVVTILTIGSRYMKLEGPGGQSRSFMIHDRLWTYLQNMITRMFWGQEQFGGGFCGAGSHKAKKSKGLRSLGTIESLLLLSEFHPRSMHFPPGDDADEIFASTDGDIIEEAQGLMKESSLAGWTEPALRSDRMCWSLVGTAYTLAFELGIFGNYADGTGSLDGGIKRISGSMDYRHRADRIERLLFIYGTLTSGRLGFPNAFPGQGVDLSNIEQIFVRPSHKQDVLQQSWVEIASIMECCNATLFGSKEKTTDLIRSGEYIGILQQLQPILDSWRNKFQSLDVPKFSRIILSIEFEYGRVYINSLALQAVLEQLTANGGQDYQHHGAPTSMSLVGLYKKNEYYIKEVIDASRNLLRHVVEGLFPNDNLKHTPVRTHMRILSGAMFLLKTFALGAKKDDIATSLHLLDETVKALQTSVVDDVHVCLRVADLLEGLTSSIRHKFVVIPSNTRASKRTLLQHYQSNPRPKDSITYPYQQPGASVDSRDNAFIMPPRETSYGFHSNQTTTPNSVGGTYEYQQLYPAPSTLSEEDWLTLDLNPLLDPVNSAFNTADPVDWFGNFGPEMNDNLEVLGKLANEQYRAEPFDSNGSGF